VVSNWFAMQDRTGPEADLAAATLSWALVGAAIQWNLSQDETFVPVNDFIARLKVLLDPLIASLLHPSALPVAAAAKPLSYPVYMDEAGMI
jgi:hypothetical protein